MRNTDYNCADFSLAFLIDLGYSGFNAATRILVRSVGQQGEYVRVKSQPVFCEAAIGGVVLSIKDFHAD